MKFLILYFLVLSFSPLAHAQFIKAERADDKSFTVQCQQDGKSWTEVVSEEAFLLGQYCIKDEVKLNSGVYEHKESKCRFDLSAFYVESVLNRLRVTDKNECLKLGEKSIEFDCEDNQCQFQNKEIKHTFSIPEFGVLLLSKDDQGQISEQKFIYQVALSSKTIGGHEVAFIKPKATSGVIGSDDRIIKTTTHHDHLVPMGPRVKVKFTNSFAIQKHPMTQEIWTSVMGFENTSTALCPKTEEGLSSCPDRPIHGVSWLQVQEFISKINSAMGVECGDVTKKEGFLLAVKTPGCYRLPTEAEWEFSMRAGVKTNFPLGRLASEKRDYDCQSKTRDKKELDYSTGFPRDVTAMPYENNWGITNTIGGVMEYVQDVFAYKYGLSLEEQKKVQTDFCLADLNSSVGQGGGGISNRVARGGAFFTELDYCSFSARTGIRDQIQARYIGFRLARSL